MEITAIQRTLTEVEGVEVVVGSRTTTVDPRVVAANKRQGVPQGLVPLNSISTQ